MKKTDFFGWVKDNWYELVKILGTIYLSSLSIFSSENIHWFYKLLAGVTGLFIVVATIISLIAQERMGVLKRQLEKANQKLANLFEIYPDLLTANLKVLFDALKLDSHCRITIYRYKEDDFEPYFLSLGRYSTNPDYAKRRRLKYKKQKDIMGLAWERGEFYYEAQHDPEENVEAYLEEMSKVQKVAKKEIRPIKMKSTIFQGFSLRDSKGHSLGVVVFESVKLNGALEQKKVKKLFNKAEAGRFVQFIEIMKDFEPDPELAAKGGF